MSENDAVEINFLSFKPQFWCMLNLWNCIQSFVIVHCVHSFDLCRQGLGILNLQLAPMVASIQIGEY
jgi:hypothetical protein